MWDREQSTWEAWYCIHPYNYLVYHALPRTEWIFSRFSNTHFYLSNQRIDVWELGSCFLSFSHIGQIFQPAIMLRLAASRPPLFLTLDKYPLSHFSYLTDYIMCPMIFPLLENWHFCHFFYLTGCDVSCSVSSTKQVTFQLLFLLDWLHYVSYK